VLTHRQLEVPTIEELLQRADVFLRVFLCDSSFVLIMTIQVPVLGETVLRGEPQVRCHLAKREFVPQNAPCVAIRLGNANLASHLRPTRCESSFSTFPWLAEQLEVGVRIQDDHTSAGPV
jgi:hypothetical protein